MPYNKQILPLEFVHTDLIELHEVELCALLAQQGLGGFAILAPGLAENSCEGTNVSKSLR